MTELLTLSDGADLADRCLCQLKPRLRPLDGVVYGLRRQSGGAGCIGLADTIDQHHAGGVRGLAAAQAQELGQGLELNVSHGLRSGHLPASRASRIRRWARSCGGTPRINSCA